MSATDTLITYLGNNSELHNAFVEEASRVLDPGFSVDQVENGIWTLDQARRFTLEDYIKAAMVDWFEGCDNLDGLLIGIVDAFLSEVNWLKIARHYLSLASDQSTV